MFETVPTFIPVLGRLLLGGAFVFAGLRNLGSMSFLTGALSARGVPLASIVLITGIAIQCVAGLLLMIGLYSAFAALGLIVFLIVATLIFHNFWDYQGEERVAHLNGVITNTALAGSFLLVVAYG
ncbi:MAG: DoxX family protein [Nitratireductor sp.]|uniref:DoxX family protein n=1 Tax=Nitratireductor sp. B36 TaxID=2762059 RepID=UPI000C98EDB3|nr:DoxX family protein [Nitratireductor sp. B36]MAS13276.1 DoxX family protein [Nitratireductor sp.]MCC5779281.1 DoxX family protein [Nitratireductor sp. B36]